jgi:hypothetical protein
VPGNAHKILVQFLVPRLRFLGYEIVASDQQYAILGGRRVPVPPVISRHMPDLLGARDDSPIFCIGEAKTAGDLRSRHTREQLIDFSAAPDCRVIIAVPASGLGTLQKVLGEEGISFNARFECMVVPDQMTAD